MKPFTSEDAEAEARAAILAGDGAAIDAAAALLDGLENPPPAQTPARTLGAALWYAQQGLRVFPLQPRRKVPYKGTRGFKDATTDEETIRRWWVQWPDSNVAMATGHVVDVVDFDGLSGHVEWGAKYGGGWAGIKRLAVVSTPRPGGLHVWCKAVSHARNAASLVPGVDYRGRGGYVVLPPSTIADPPHPGTYRFIVPYQP